jgi:phosphoribosyl-AMP cyclohydrolase / phosphoribosyl-ATP pyrophosphohydrolase
MTASTERPLASRLDFDKNGGWVTVIAQDARTGRVLMTARADAEAIAATLATGEMHYHSRTRGLWHKGATSGSVQRVVALAPDCDGDALLARVVPAGPACHTGQPSCFGLDSTGLDALEYLDRVIARRASPAAAPDELPGVPSEEPPIPTSYTQQLLADRNLRLKKLGEEAAELAVACADEDAVRATEECADLLYHALVAVRALGVGIADVSRVLAGRAR